MLKDCAIPTVHKPNAAMMNAKQILTLTISILLSFTVVAQEEEDNNVVVWNDSIKLQIGDFKATPPIDVKHDAAAFVGLDVHNTFLDKQMLYHIESIFDKTRSFFKGNSKELLIHEQGHFSLAEIYARKIRCYLDECSRKSRHEQEIIQMIDGLQKEYEQSAALYDRETNHSRDSAQQKKWNSKIDKELSSLKTCQTNRGIINVK